MSAATLAEALEAIQSLEARLDAMEAEVRAFLVEVEETVSRLRAIKGAA